MVRAKIKGVNAVRKVLADGTVRRYYYHRTTGKALPGLPGDPDFIAALAAAEKTFSDRHRGTFNQLSHAFSTSPEFAGLADSTRKEYGRMLSKAEDRFGSMPIAALDDAAVRQVFMEWRRKLAEKSGHREADNRLSVISALLTWAKDNGHIANNHIQGFKRLYHSDRADTIWLPEHIAAFMKVAPVELQRALILALHTGQRQGDLRRLTWASYDGQWITLKQGKSRFRTQVEIPCTAALRRMLDSIKRSGLVVLTTRTGRPWTARYFSRQWEIATAAAGIEGLHFHDLRGTAVTMLSEAGCTPQQIATITGHSLKSVTVILDKYLARTRHLAAAAIALFQNAKATRFANRLQTGPSRKQKGDAK
ncbi:MAG: tyrosine-type recombinase/integrase [Hyphomicrobiales bacterium]|nr:tyrosine-type recombinase/integrase [Hyphomicrobiales bacterium]